MVVADTGGLFTQLSGATVQNLCLEQVYVKGEYIGGIAGKSYGDTIIHNCYVGGTLECSYSYGVSAGIVGRCYSGTLTIENCYSACEADSGILDSVYNYDSKVQIENCVSTGNYTTAGILGYAGTGSASIKNCYSSGVIGSGGGGVV